jgi:hypothetical protein
MQHHVNPKGVVRESDLTSLRERNEARAKELAQKMGRSYLLHPSNRVRRINQPKWRIE